MNNNQNKNYRNKEQDRRLETLEKKVGQVFGHIATTNTEMGQIKTDVSWLKKTYWVVVSASVGALITGIITILIIVLSKN